MESKLDDIENKIWDNIDIDLDDSEIENLTKDFDIENIKQKAFNGIKENVSNNNINKPRKILKVIFSLAACLCLLCATVYAMRSLNGFREFYGDSINIIENDIVQIGKKISRNGITMEVEDAIMSGDSAIVILNFTRDNGEAFPYTTAFGDFEVVSEELEKNKEILNLDDDNDNQEFPSLAWSGKFTDDNKKMLVWVDINDTDKLVNRNIEVFAKDIFYYDNEEYDFDVNLSDIYNAYPVNLTLGEDEPDNSKYFVKQIREGFENQQNIVGEIKLPLENKYNDLKFFGIGFKNNKLCIVTTCPLRKNKETYIQYDAAISKIIDTRNGNEYSYNTISREHYIYNDKLVVMSSFQEYDISKEDLPYLKAKVKYTIPHIIGSGEWNISFALNDAEVIEPIEKTLDLVIDKDGEKLKIEKVVISPIKTVLYMNWEDKEKTEALGIPASSVEISIQLKNGTVLSYAEIANNYGKDYLKHEYKLIAEQEISNYGILSSEQLKNIESIKVGENIIKF